MTLLKSLCIAFSIYSKIPVPNFEWKEKEFKYNLIFFPWVGAVIGALLLFWHYIAQRFQLGALPYALIGTAIPLLVTGGFHADGFMDTMDAFSSGKSREEKLHILKDPHIGAFAVIKLAAAGLVYIAAFSAISNFSVICVFSCSFFLARALSAIAVIVFPKAKSSGMLHAFSTSANEGSSKTVLIPIICEAAACTAFMIWINAVCGAVLVAAALIVFVYYKNRSLKELGGITGDTAGYFVVIAETTMCVCAAAYSVVVII
ncbi:MAG TPA: adenosylcobinamide-GDP ribazoletransferase [Candidatus Alectryocaccobium stercorigallinarum]|nr:adenosylcobinamide-GDP ribazoletransferase [Candidatus Alectryocaccobium stercorigallinarum]